MLSYNAEQATSAQLGPGKFLTWLKASPFYIAILTLLCMWLKFR